MKQIGSHGDVADTLPRGTYLHQQTHPHSGIIHSDPEKITQSFVHTVQVFLDHPTWYLRTSAGCVSVRAFSSAVPRIYNSLTDDAVESLTSSLATENTVV